MSFQSVLRLLLFCCAVATLAPARAQTNPFESEIRAFEAQDAVRRPPADSVVFIGSSTIKMWTDLAQSFPRFNTLNRGFGGSQTADALFFVDRIATPYRPPLIVFYEGDNDLWAGDSVDQVFNETTNFFALVQSKSPNTHILYVSVKPSPSRVSILTNTVELNARVKAFTETNPKLHYVDTYTPMLDGSGRPRQELFLSDDLHMNQAGYALWTSILRPVLDEFAAAYPISILKSESGSLLVDLGAADAPTGSSAPSTVSWNNVTSLGSSATGSLTLVTTAGAQSAAQLQMVSRFNGANENGTTASTLFPASATRDSLYGNTEAFNNLSNIRPVFKITGLDAGTAYSFTFFASRTGVNDNRQTRYTVSGAATNSADLNAANNVDQVAVVSGAQPDETGAITIALTPGPANNNANHFTYLGALKIETATQGGPVFLIDFGASGSTTATQAGSQGASWNNLFPDIGTTDDGTLALVTTNGAGSGITWQMTSRFNGANTSGTTASSAFPGSATGDSLFGNTEAFNSLSGIVPAFKLRGLLAAATYDFEFFASRTGATDNRETRYTVAGATTATADLDASNNIDATARVTGIRADAQREIAISLAPGPNNNNANHFTYLGVLRVNWTTADGGPAIRLETIARSGNGVRLRANGAAGMIYTLQLSTDMRTWEDVRQIALTEAAAEVEVENTPAAAFYRLLQ
jgi:lysophospholipase L1-like esterase